MMLAASGCGYNTIQTYDEQVNAAESQIKVQLQRRADLVPNLVETVKGYARQEQTIFTEVAEARAKLAGAVQSGSLEQMAQANAALTAPLGRFSVPSSWSWSAPGLQRRGEPLQRLHPAVSAG